MQAHPAPAGLAGLLSRLDKVRRSGPDKWIARCPSHDDRSPSLSVKDTDGRVLVHCHAGCSAEAVVAAVGLELQDLFDEPLEPGTRRDLARQHSRKDLLAAIRFELQVLLISLLDTEREPYAKPDPSVVERETLAGRRLVHLLGQAYQGGSQCLIQRIGASPGRCGCGPGCQGWRLPGAPCPVPGGHRRGASRRPDHP